MLILFGICDQNNQNCLIIFTWSQ